MKIANNTIKSTVTLAVLAIVLVFSSAKANATDKIKNPTVEVKYIGTVDNSPLFQVEFDNVEGEEIYISLRDVNGNILYAGTTKEKRFSKRFRLENIELNDTKITLNVRSKKATQSTVFEINKSVRQVEEVVVNKL